MSTLLPNGDGLSKLVTRSKLDAGNRGAAAIAMEEVAIVHSCAMGLFTVKPRLICFDSHPLVELFHAGHGGAADRCLVPIVSGSPAKVKKERAFHERPGHFGLVTVRIVDA